MTSRRILRNLARTALLVLATGALTTLAAPAASAAATWSDGQWTYTPDHPVLSAQPANAPPPDPCRGRPGCDPCFPWERTPQERAFAIAGGRDPARANEWAAWSTGLQLFGYATDIGHGYFQHRAEARQMGNTAWRVVGR